MKIGLRLIVHALQHAIFYSHLITCLCENTDPAQMLSRVATRLLKLGPKVRKLCEKMVACALQASSGMHLCFFGRARVIFVASSGSLTTSISGLGCCSEASFAPSDPSRCSTGGFAGPVWAAKAFPTCFRRRFLVLFIVSVHVLCCRSWCRDACNEALGMCSGWGIGSVTFRLRLHSDALTVYVVCNVVTAKTFALLKVGRATTFVVSFVLALNRASMIASPSTRVWHVSVTRYNVSRPRGFMFPRRSGFSRSRVREPLGSHSSFTNSECRV